MRLQAQRLPMLELDLSPDNWRKPDSLKQNSHADSIGATINETHPVSKKKRYQLTSLQGGIDIFNDIRFKAFLVSD